jgi:hypothetical protein
VAYLAGRVLAVVGSADLAGHQDFQGSPYRVTAATAVLEHRDLVGILGHQLADIQALAGKMGLLAHRVTQGTQGHLQVGLVAILAAEYRAFQGSQVNLFLGLAGTLAHRVILAHP